MPRIVRRAESLRETLALLRPRAALAKDHSLGILRFALGTAAAVRATIASVMAVARMRGSVEHERLVEAGAPGARLEGAAVALEVLCAEIDSAAITKLASLDAEVATAGCVYEEVINTLRLAADCVCAGTLPPEVLILAVIKRVAAALANAELDSAASIEPTTFFLTAATGNNHLGTLCAPRSLHTGDISVRSPAAFALAGRNLVVKLILAPACMTRCAEEEVEALAWLYAAATVSVTLGGVLATSQAVFNAEQGCIDVSVWVPETPLGAPISNAIVELSRAEVLLAFELPVVAGVVPPFVLDGVEPNDGASPAITVSGTIYLPVGGEGAVLVFEGDGAQLPSIPLEPLGLTDSVEAAAFVEMPFGILLLADKDHIVAVDAVTHVPRWINHGALVGCNGLGVLPLQGVVVASSLEEGAVHVFRLSDGSKIFSIALVGPRFLASDPASAMVYVSMRAGVAALLWDGGVLSQTLVVPGTEHPSSSQPVAVIPSPHGVSLPRSYLIVGKYGKPGLRLFTLPHLALLAEFEVPSSLGPLRVLGIAADPRGAAIAVVARDKRGAGRVHVLAWQPLLKNLLSG